MSSFPTPRRRAGQEAAPPAVPVPELADDAAGFRGGSGTPLVLLHGLSMSPRAWKPVLPFLSARHDVFAPALPGHRGGPELRCAADGMDGLVDQVCELLDEAGIATAHVAGNSLGGWLALELARRGRARSVVAFSPAGAWQSSRDLMRLIGMFRMGRGLLDLPAVGPLARRPALQRAGMRRTMRHPERVPAADLVEMVTDMLDCDLLSVLFTGGPGRVPRLAPVDVAACPVHIAWGGADKVIPYRRYGRPLRERVPGAEFEVLPGVGHVPMWDAPRLVARTVLEMTSAVDEAGREAPPRQPRPRRARRAPSSAA